MSENQKDFIPEEQDDFSSSTIFSAPSEHKDKKKAGKYSLVLRLVAIFLVVALLGGSVWWVTKYIAEKTAKEGGTFQPEQMTILSATSFKKLTVIHDTATLVLNSSMQEESGQQKQVWTLEGYDETLIDKTSLGQIATYASAVTVFGEYEYDEKTQKAQFGLDKPIVTVKVEANDAKQNFVLTQGNVTADGQYAYLHISTFPQKIYLVNRSTLTGFIVEPLDLAISTAIPAIEKTKDNAGYFDSEGVLTDFDTLTISGSKFKNPLVFIPNKDNRFSSYATYICTSPKLRIADGVIEDIRNSFANGVSASGAVSFDQSKESIKKFGLDNPDIVITLKVAGKNYSYKLKATDDSFTQYFILASTDRMIRTVTISNMEYLNNEEKDFYLGFMALESIGDISEFVTTGDVNAAFTLAKKEDEEGYDIKCNGNTVDSEAFQNFYALFIGTTAIDYNTKKVSGRADLTVTLKHHDGSAPTVLSFFKISDSRYQYSVGGTAMGQISSTAYDKLVREIEKLIK